MIIKPKRRKGRLIIVTDSEEYDLTLYSSKPKYFYVADHADEHIDYLGTELSGCRDEITRLQAERDAMREEIAELRDGNEYVLVRELREQLRWRHWPEAPTKNGEYLFDHEEIPEKEVVSWIDGEWSVHNTYKTNHRWLPIPQDTGRDL